MPKSNLQVLYTISWTQCGNFMFFPSLRFYVKSILGILEVQNLPFYHIYRLWIWFFVNFLNFSLQKVPKFLKKSNFRAFKYVEIADFALLKSPNLISHKIWVVEKLWNFHTMQQLEPLTSEIYFKFFMGNTTRSSISYSFQDLT